MSYVVKYITPDIRNYVSLLMRIIIQKTGSSSSAVEYILLDLGIE